MRPLSIALVHYPVLSKDGSTVTTSITNLDIHDIARTAFTYGVTSYFLVHPVSAQRELAERVVQHWIDGSGAERIPDRKPPMERVQVVDSLSAAQDRIEQQLGTKPELWVTSAQPLASPTSHAEAAQRLHGEGPPVLLVFGTGWGLARPVITASDVRLAPIQSPRQDGYNHLSVRAAAAILVDRLVVRDL